ncbi:MAG: histidine phosphatase family protein [Tepidibacillus sp.]
MKTKIFLIRHGETEWNKEKRFQGQKDIPLNRFGQSQAEKVAQRFYKENYKVDAVYSSDLKRAKETAKAIAYHYGKDVQVHIGLRERSYGLLEGNKIEDITAKYGIHLGNLEEAGAFDVEPFHLLKNRVYSAVREIVKWHAGENVVIVSHGGAINSLLHEISQGEYGPGKTRIVNTSITTITYDHLLDFFHIEDVNNASHVE